MIVWSRKRRRVGQYRAASLSGLVALHVGPQQRVDPGLVARPLRPEPFQYLPVEPDGHGRFRFGQTEDVALEKLFFQWSAKAMAEQGYTARQILEYYYQGAIFSTLR